MPFFAHTPEALAQRSDSNNSSSRCRGLTNRGEPCQRFISASTRSRGQNSEAVNYCWQHKDQAPKPTALPPQTFSVQERTSIDTLVDRLGLLEVQNGNSKPNSQVRPAKPPRPQAAMTATPQQGKKHEGTRPSQPPKNNQSAFRLICCALVEDEDPAPARPARPQNGRPSGRQSSASVPGVTKPQGNSSRPRPSSARPSMSTSRPSDKTSVNSQGTMGPQRFARPGQAQLRPPVAPGGRSKTAEYLSLIPSSVPTETASQLLAELVKPVSVNDDEGYIYIFWLTPESLPSPPPLETARTLLEPPTDPFRPSAGRRRTSDVLRTYSTSTSKDPNRRTLLLKIGRASNVQRRLNEWTRQCGYAISLIRYYPYYNANRAESPLPPSTGSSLSPGQQYRRGRAHSAEPPGPAKVPYSHKVERLIHLELASRRAKDSGKCAACGREHREWFEVDATREGLAAVHAVIMRWVAWSNKEFAGGK